jgi:hypothetical protein
MFGGNSLLGLMMLGGGEMMAMDDLMQMMMMRRMFEGNAPPSRNVNKARG